MRILGLIIFCIALTSGEPYRLSLSEALKQGLEHNFDIRIQKKENQKIQNNKAVVIGAMLPNLDAKAGSHYSVAEKTSDSPISLGSGEESSLNMNAGLELNWTLFDGFKMFAGKKAYDVSADISQSELKLNLEILAVQVIQSYYEVAANQFLMRSAENQLDISSRRLRKMEMRKELGAATERDFLNAKVAYNADRSALHNRNLQHFNSVEDLKMLMGFPKWDSLIVEENVNYSKNLKDVSYWLKHAEEKNKTLSLKQKILNLEKLNESIARSSYWPLIIATGSYNYTNTNTSLPSLDVNTESNGLSVGIQARMPLFAGFKNVTALKNSKLDIRAKELDLEKFQKELESLIRRQHAVLVNARKQIDFELEAVELARKNMETTEAQLNLGGSENLEFREAQLAYFQSEIRLAQAKFQYQLASVELERLSGLFSIPKED